MTMPSVLRGVQFHANVPDMDEELQAAQSLVAEEHADEVEETINGSSNKAT